MLDHIEATAEATGVIFLKIMRGGLCRAYRSSDRPAFI